MIKINKIQRVLLIVLLVGGLLTGCVNNSDVRMLNGTKKQKEVYMITKSTTSTFYQTMFSGAEAASSAYNLKLVIQGAENEEDYETQNKLILEAAKSGCDAIILSAADYQASSDVVNQVAKEGVNVIIVDSDVNSNLVQCRIGTDNYNAGSLAAEALLNDTKGDLHVGIINFDENTENGQERERGFRTYIEHEERVKSIETVNVLSTIEDAKEKTKEFLLIHPEVNAIVTFNEWTSLGVGYAIQELGTERDVQVVAFDSNVVSVGMLETGEVDALIVQNPYAMGYLGVETAYYLLKGYQISGGNVDTAIQIVTRENMYNEEVQKLLFTFE